jgi:hypothetical protein
MLRGMALRTNFSTGLALVSLVVATAVSSCASPNNVAVVNGGTFKKQIDMRDRQEQQTGRCSPEHQAALETALQKLTDTFTVRSEYSGFKSVGAQFVVAKETGVNVAIDAGLGGEYHIFGYGYSPLTMSAEDQFGNVIEAPSNRAHIAAVVGEVPASLMLPQAKGDYLVTMKGRGCALVATFKRVY